MKKLIEIKNYLSDIRDKKVDIVSDIRTMEVERDGDKNILVISGRRHVAGTDTPTDSTEGEKVEAAFEASPQALNQFFSKLGIPAPYAERIPLDLLNPLIKHAKQQIGTGGEVFVRAYEPEPNVFTARAILSNKYGLMDNDTVVDKLIEVYGEGILHVDVRNLEIDKFGDAMNLRITDDRYQVIGEDPNGKANPYFGGLHITNGETGKYSLSASALIWEQWCQNGAVRERYKEPLMRRRHIGSSGEIFNLFSEMATSAPGIYEDSLNAFSASRKMAVQSPYAALYNLFKTHSSSFPDAVKVRIFEAFESRKEMTRYGIASAITAGVQRVPNLSFEKRKELESLAGNLLFFKSPLDEHGNEAEIIETFNYLAEKVKRGENE